MDISILTLPFLYLCLVVFKRRINMKEKNLLEEKTKVVLKKIFYSGKMLLRLKQYFLLKSWLKNYRILENSSVEANKSSLNSSCYSSAITSHYAMKAKFLLIFETIKTLRLYNCTFAYVAIVNDGTN